MVIIGVVYGGVVSKSLEHISVNTLKGKSKQLKQNKKRKTYKKLFTYNDTGNIKIEKNYRNGKKWGLEILYHDNGNVKYKEVIYKKNGNDKPYFMFTGYEKYGKLIKDDETWWDGFEVKSGECYKDNEEVDCYAPYQNQGK